MDIVNITIIASIIVQLITGIVSLDGFQYKLNPEDGILKTILGLETGVQFVELLFYIVFAAISIPLTNLATIRYYDWFFTTPAMLISTMMYFYYLARKQNTALWDSITSATFLKKHWPIITFVVLANFAMLLFGYLAEICSISLIEGFLWGFVFFGFSFYGIYSIFVKDSHIIKEKMDNEPKKQSEIQEEIAQSKEIYILFTFLLIIWGLYGIVFVLDDKWKNISFNILDIISKNFYGLYIYWKIIETAV